MADEDTTATAQGAASTAFRDVPVTLIVSVGRARTSIGTLLSLDRNAVITLDKGIDDPVTIYAGDRIVALGELQELVDDPGQLAVRITEIVSDSDEAG